MYELQKLLTHSSPQMTQRYAQLHDDALRKASDLAGALFSEARENPAPALDVPAASEIRVRKKKASVA
jgi:integrase